VEPDDRDSDLDDGGPWLLVFTQHQDDDVDLRLWGDLDAASAADLRRELDRVARDLRPGAVVSVDASALTFIDSVGIRALANGRRAVLRSQGRFRLRASDALERLLELTGMTDLLVDS
jgi:anti-anti-sigma factor